MLRITLNILYRWYWLIILVTVLTGVVSYLIFQQQPTMYRSTALLLVGPSTSSPNPELNDLRTSGQLLETYAALATTRPALESIIDELNLNLSPSRLRENMEISTTPETQILSIRVLDEDRDQAIAIANAIAGHILSFSPTSPEGDDADPYRTLLLEQIARLEERIDSSQGLIEQLQENLTTATTRDERTAILNNILQEQNRLSEMERFLVSIYDSLQRPDTNRIEVIEPATTAQRVSTQTGIKTLISAVAGFILGLVVSVGFEYFNDTVTSVQDIPLSKDAAMLDVLFKPSRQRPAITADTSGRTKPNWKEIERYRNLAAKLQPALWSENGSKGGQAGKALLVTATPESEEVTEIIVNLAIVLTQMGLRVVLVDANYDSSSLSRLFKLSKESGLSEVVVNGLPAPTAIEHIKGLSVLPSGKAPPSSFALLASEAVDQALEELKRETDVVLVAAPDASSSDTAILGSKMDGVIIVTFRGRTHRAAIQAGIQALPKTIGLILVDHSTGFRRFLEQKASM